MFNNRYSNVLTIILIVAIIGVVGLLIFLGVDIYNKYYIEREASQGVSQFDAVIPDANEQVESNEIVIGLFDTNTTNEDTQNEIVNPYANVSTNNSNNNASKPSNQASSNKVYYKGFVQEGTISIPRTGLSCPILENASKKAIEVAVGIQVGPGLNQIGNTVIAGHNYRNGLFFSNNKNIQVGDKIYIKDTSGRTVTYVVYNKFETTPEDASYINKDTNGKREITLYSCNDDSSKRIIIEAREQ